MVNPNNKASLDPNVSEKRGFLKQIGNFMLKPIGKNNKPTIAEEILIIYEEKMLDLRFFAKMAYVMDNSKFCGKEFLSYVKINYCLKQGIQGYDGLYQATKLLQVAIQAKDSFLKIDQTELRYRGKKQQEVYDFVGERLIALEEMTDSTSIFRSQIKSKMEEVIPKVKTDEGKAALEVYVKELDKIADHDLGLKLLSIFKTYHLDDYSILKKFSDLAESIEKADLADVKKLETLVALQFETFEKLGLIIGIPQEKNTQETYTIILQYIALEHRHGMVRMKFDGLVDILKKWYKPYEAIITIRNQFTADEYQIPKEFTEPIPGVDLYEKYQDALTDKKTGINYINFDE